MELRCARHIINIKRVGEVGAFASELQPPSLFGRRLMEWRSLRTDNGYNRVTPRVFCGTFSLRVRSDTRDEARRRRIEGISLYDSPRLGHRRVGHR
jgi:hypothetical protein